MKVLFKPGDKKLFRRVVTERDIAAFDGDVVHQVYATFAVARDAEWTSRLFVLDMLDADEEGIGTFLSVDHKNPAFVNEEVLFVAWVDQLNNNELACFFEAKVGDRLIAIGRTGQKILKKEKIRQIFSMSRSV